MHPFVHQRHHRRRTGKKAHPPKVSTKAPAQPNLPRLEKYPCRQSCQRINSNQLHLWKKCDTDRCSADDAGNGPPALAACQRTQQHRQCSQQSAQRDAAEGDVAQRYNQHRGGQHHADKICPCQGEQTLSQRKRLESPRQKNRHRRLPLSPPPKPSPACTRKRTVPAAMPPKAAAVQKMPAAAPLLSAAWSIRCVLRCGAPG